MADLVREAEGGQRRRRAEREAEDDDDEERREPPEADVDDARGAARGRSPADPDVEVTFERLR